MTAHRVTAALEELTRFDPDDHVPAPELAIRFIALAARFSRALSGTSAERELASRADRLTALMAAGTQFGRCRQAALAKVRSLLEPFALADESHPAVVVWRPGGREWVAEEGGRFRVREEITLCPVATLKHLEDAEHLLWDLPEAYRMAGMLLAGPAGAAECDELLAWQREIFRVRLQIEQSRLFGAYLIRLCQNATDPDRETLEEHDRLADRIGRCLSRLSSEATAAAADLGLAAACEPAEHTPRLSPPEQRRESSSEAKAVPSVRGEDLPAEGPRRDRHPAYLSPDEPLPEGWCPRSLEGYPAELGEAVWTNRVRCPHSRRLEDAASNHLVQVRELTPKRCQVYFPTEKLFLAAQARLSAFRKRKKRKKKTSRKPKATGPDGKGHEQT